MSRRTSRQSQGFATRRKGQTIVAVILVVSLFAAWTMLASSGAPNSGLKQKGTKDGTVSPANFSSPAKEYVYAGGRLVATEEPSLHHASTIGVYRPGNTFFYLRNTNTAGNPDISVPFGASGDIPVVGDWDGNGTVTIGVYRASISTFFLRNSNSIGPRTFRSHSAMGLGEICPLRATGTETERGRSESIGPPPPHSICETATPRDFLT